MFCPPLTEIYNNNNIHVNLSCGAMNKIELVEQETYNKIKQFNTFFYFVY